MGKGRLRRTLLAAWVAMAMAMGVVSPAAAAPEACADLSVTDISFNPAQPIQGQMATVSITVQNTGCATPGFVVQWKPDPFAPTGPSQAVTSLGANASVVVNLQFAFPNAGNFTTVVQVDTANDVSEINEINNLEIAPVTVLPATIDLVVTDIAFSPVQPVSGWVTTASITVENNGNTAAGPFRVEWTPGIFVPPYSVQVDSLAAGASTVVNFDHVFPWAGNWSGWASVDTASQVFETDEFNNTYFEAVDVDPPLPDLIVQNAVISPANPVPGQIATMTITVENIGHVAAGNFRVQWQPWWLASPLSQQVNSLDAGATANVIFTYTYPWSGTFDGTVTVDPWLQVLELEEFNNSKQVSVTAAPNIIDLVITNATISPASPTQGAPATVNVTVQNNGNTPAGNFMVEWNPDSLFLISPSPATQTKQVFGLGPGQSTTVSFNYSYSKFGDFRTVATVDAHNNILESNEANNQRILNVTVQPAPIDLVITNFTLNPASPIRTATTTASITVQNSGPFAANDFAVQWQPTEGDVFGPLQFVSGLNPGQSTTLTFESSYFTTGDFVTAAIVDVFDQVVEPGAGAEANNTATKNITVQPSSATLRITLTNVHVVESLEDGCVPGFNCDGEWEPVALMVADDSATCNLSAFGQSASIDGIRCTQKDFPDVETGDNLSGFSSIDVTLQDFEPLVIAVAGVERDSAPIIGDIGGNFLGYAITFGFPPDYLEGTFTIDGEGGDGGCPGGKCFEATINVQILSSVP